MIDYIKENFVRWLLYATIGAGMMALVVFFGDWISDDIKNYLFYATKFFKGFVVFCILIPILDFGVELLSERFRQDVPSLDEFKEVWFYQGYKNGMCVAEVVYKHPMNEGEFEHKFAYINETGEKISSDLFDIATEFTPYGYGQVCINGKYNLIDKTGKYLSEEWFTKMSNPDVDGCIKVGNEKHLTNFLNKEGKLMWTEWKEEL